jgi:hypothetical protein
MRRRALFATLALVAAPSTFTPSAVSGREREPGPSLRPDQHASLVLLGRVWGFAKYHHPRFAVSGADVDSALFAAVPRVLAAPSAASGRDSVAAWLDAVGPPPPCASACATPATTPALAPDIDWIRDTVLVGPAVAERLERIYAARPRDGAQHYVRPVARIGNPEFIHEPVYGRAALDRPEVRLLGVFRL